MKKLLSLLLCLGLCCGCSNSTSSGEEVEDVDSQEDIVEEVESLLSEDQEDIQSLLLCMNYDNEDNAYIDNFFNRGFNEDYIVHYMDFESEEELPGDLDSVFMLFDDSIGYNVAQYYLESICNLDLNEDLKKSTATVEDLEISNLTHTSLIITRQDMTNNYSFSNYLVVQSDLGEDYYDITYTLSDGTNTYDDCKATIYANAHSWFGYTIYEFEQGGNQVLFELYENEYSSSQTDFTSISNEEEATEYIETILNVPGQVYTVNYIYAETSTIFGDYYYINGSWNDVEAIIPETGMIITMDYAQITYNSNGIRSGNDIIMVDKY